MILWNKNSSEHLLLIAPQRSAPFALASVCSHFSLRPVTALKLVHVSKELAEKHYADLSSKPFFPALVDYSADP